MRNLNKLDTRKTHPVKKILSTNTLKRENAQFCQRFFIDFGGKKLINVNDEAFHQPNRWLSWIPPLCGNILGSGKCITLSSFIGYCIVSFGRPVIEKSDIIIGHSAHVPRPYIVLSKCSYIFKTTTKVTK